MTNVYDDSQVDSDAFAVHEDLPIMTAQIWVVMPHLDDTRHPCTADAIEL